MFCTPRQEFLNTLVLPFCEISSAMMLLGFITSEKMTFQQVFDGGHHIDHYKDARATMLNNISVPCASYESSLVSELG